jgi:lipopolysaccharide transport system ATP-binding protein
MSDIAIRVENLSKQYRIGGPQAPYKTIRESLTEAVQAPFRRLSSIVRGQSSAVSNETIWALKDVSFEVKRGEVVGIIGRNGAGKTTLLKVLSRITEPTEGQAIIRGRVGSLLEVGTGFHPELTGRENIYLNGAILGMKKGEIERKFDEIVAFAEIEKFIDTPVKHYSSGMYVRLAFAVAAHLEPEILLVDEVLAVGDAAFQKKCLGKMDDVAKQGRTVMFVSHNMSAVNNLCESAVVLEQGRILYEGPSGDAIRYYLQDLSNNGKEHAVSDQISFPKDLSKPLQVRRLSIKNGRKELSTVINYQEDFYIDLEIDLRQANQYYIALMFIANIHGNIILVTTDEDLTESPLARANVGEYQYSVRFPGKLLKPGEYHLTVSLVEKGIAAIDKHEAIISFEIQDVVSRRSRHQVGYRKAAMVAPEIPWTLAPT